jgi:hypothetical protein
VAHCPSALLDDVVDVLDDVRGWAGVVEKKPGVFYASRYAERGGSTSSGLSGRKSRSKASHSSFE